MSIEKRIISGNPNISQVSLSNLSGEEWQNLSDEEKKKFKDMEVVDKERVKKEESIRNIFLKTMQSQPKLSGVVGMYMLVPI